MTSIGQNETSRGSLIDAYLTDLERALVRVGVTDREEVFSNIVEHIDEQRSTDASAESDTELLKQLGSVDDIARSAAEGEVTHSAMTFDSPQQHNDDFLLLIVSIVALVLCLLPLPVGFFLAIGEGVVLLRSRKKVAPWSSMRKTALVLNVAGIALSAFILLGLGVMMTSSGSGKAISTPAIPLEQKVPTNP